MALRTFATLGALLLLSAAGCASSKSAEQPTSESSTQAHHHHEGGQGMGGMCPMDVPDTTVSAADVDGGVALSFSTTDPDSVDDLRQRIHRMAAMHNEKHAGGNDGMPAAAATAEDTPNGARIVIRPNDPSLLDELRSRVQQRAQHLNEEGCPHKGMHHSHPGEETDSE